MNTIEIIKNAVILPFRAYKGFILVTFLFLLSEIVNETFNMVSAEDLTFVYMFIPPIFSIIILGLCIAIVYHYIDDSFDIREVSIKTTTKAGFKDLFIESYYYTLTVILTAAISYAFGIYHNIYSLIDGLDYIGTKVENLTLPGLIALLTPDRYNELAFSVVATLAIFVIFFSIFLSYCSLGKIRLKETGKMGEALSLTKLTRIINQKGIRKYLNLVILTSIISGAVLLIMKTLQSYVFTGSLISALTEAFALFFILDSFSLYYYS